MDMVEQAVKCVPGRTLIGWAYHGMFGRDDLLVPKLMSQLAAESHPRNGPARFPHRAKTMPNSREKKEGRPGADGDLPGGASFKNATTGVNQNEGKVRQDATLVPVELINGRMRNLQIIFAWSGNSTSRSGDIDAAAENSVGYGEKMMKHVLTRLGNVGSIRSKWHVERDFAHDDLAS